MLPRGRVEEEGDPPPMGEGEREEEGKEGGAGEGAAQTGGSEEDILKTGQKTNPKLPQRKCP